MSPWLIDVACFMMLFSDNEPHQIHKALQEEKKLPGPEQLA